MTEGMLVSREWLEKVDRFINAANDEKSSRAKSSFYGARPAVLASSWEHEQGVYKATARFIVNGVVDERRAFAVYAPTATEPPSGEVGTARFFVVYRGRWEIVAAGGSAGGCDVRTGTIVRLIASEPYPKYEVSPDVGTTNVVVTLRTFPDMLAIVGASIVYVVPGNGGENFAINTSGIGTVV